MKLVSLNIEFNTHTDVVLDFLRKEDPDVICFQELLEEDFEFYKKEFGGNAVFRVCRYESRSAHPHIIGKKQGVGIFSKNIVDAGSMFYVGDEGETSRPFDQNSLNNTQALVWADIKNEDGEVYRFVTVHMPVTKHGESTPFQIEALDSLFSKIEPLGEFILCGDMNAPRGRETFKRLAERFKDNIPLEYKTSIDQNLHRVKGLQLMVDGLFTTSTYKAMNVKLVDGVSDHMAIVAEISKDHLSMSMARAGEPSMSVNLSGKQ
ncbi:MAG: endonuclease/exonuclease/phosphatase family protein [Patescibacteria group bacterium]